MSRDKANHPIAPRLLQWFAEHGRHNLPWQSDKTAYRVWVSEIMLQQTQVLTVIPFYERFMARFPNVETLADSDLDDVLHHWTGLGYYARARNLHRCAQIVKERHRGEFPLGVDALASLPGIGRSTAGAIAAIAQGQPAAILDGNVKRVLARYFAIAGWPGKSAVAKALWQVAEAQTPALNAGTYAQAIMDLGATVCTRRNPACDRCPLQLGCRAHATAAVHEYPGKKPKRDQPLRQTTMLMVTSPAGEILLEQRPPTGIWGGLWSLPEATEEPAGWCARELGATVASVEPMPSLRHTFTHFHLDITPLRVTLAQHPAAIMDGARRLWYNPAAPARIGMPAAVLKLLTPR